MTAVLPATDAWNAPEWDGAVERFLRANPTWLAEHPELYRCLTPPVRLHGEVFADHMAAMVVRERRHASTMAEQTQALLATKRAGTADLSRIHSAVLALMAADDAHDFISSDLPRILQVDVACAWLRSDAADRTLARLEPILGCRDVVFRAAPDDATLLYREAASLARHDALIRLPELGVLGLASRNPLSIDQAQMQAGLHFLGQAVARALLA